MIILAVALALIALVNILAWRCGVPLKNDITDDEIDQWIERQKEQS